MAINKKAKQQIDHPGSDQQLQHRLARYFAQDFPEAPPLRRTQLIRAPSCQALGSDLGRKSVAGIDLGSMHGAENLASYVLRMQQTGLRGLLPIKQRPLILDIWQS